MKHRNLTTEGWSRMAIDSLFERGGLNDWREFVRDLKRDREIAENAVAVCGYSQDRGSAQLAMVFLRKYYPDLA